MHNSEKHTTNVPILWKWACLVLAWRILKLVFEKTTYHLIPLHNLHTTHTLPVSHCAGCASIFTSSYFLQNFSVSMFVGFRIQKEQSYMLVWHCMCFFGFLRQPLIATQSHLHYDYVHWNIHCNLCRKCWTNFHFRFIVGLQSKIIIIRVACSVHAIVR